MVESKSGREGEAFAPRNSRWMQLRTRGMLLASMDASWNAGSVNGFSVIISDNGSDTIRTCCFAVFLDRLRECRFPSWCSAHMHDCSTESRDNPWCPFLLVSVWRPFIQQLKQFPCVKIKLQGIDHRPNRHLKTLLIQKTRRSLSATIKSD